jgi:hypothetical protein
MTHRTAAYDVALESGTKVLSIPYLQAKLLETVRDTLDSKDV